MTKEQQAKKIITVYEKIIRHIIIQFEARIKTEKDLLDEELKKETDFIRRLNSISSTLKNIWKHQASANDQLKTAKEQTKLMLEAYNIKIEEIPGMKYSIDSRDIKTYCEISDKTSDIEAELDKIRKESK